MIHDWISCSSWSRPGRRARHRASRSSHQWTSRTPHRVRECAIANITAAAFARAHPQARIFQPTGYCSLDLLRGAETSSSEARLAESRREPRSSRSWSTCARGAGAEPLNSSSRVLRRARRGEVVVSAPPEPNPALASASPRHQASPSLLPTGFPRRLAAVSRRSAFTSRGRSVGERTPLQWSPR